MSKNQDVFLIVKNYSKESQTELQPLLKRRKPTAHSWNDQEHFQYLKFFQQNSFFVQSQIVRKRNKIFVRMTEYIPTRTSIQIKSHHQKLISKFKSIPSILQQLYRYLNILPNYKKQFKSKQTQQFSTQYQAEHFEEGISQSLGQNYGIPLDTSRSSIFKQLDELNEDIFSVLENMPNQTLFKMSAY